MRQIRVLLGLVALAVAVNCQGCQIFPYRLQPWKLNRQPAMDEGHYSVSDPAHPPVIVAPANHDADLYPAQ